MKVAVMQPYLFPYIGYYQLIKEVDHFVFYDDVNFIKGGWINRNNILVNGEGFLFNIPLQEVSQNKSINQINIEENTNWKKNILKTIFKVKKMIIDASYFIVSKSDFVSWNLIW